jgi:hypothetical protein
LTYEYLERILGEKWLKNNPDHTYNQWIVMSTHSQESKFLNRLDGHIGKTTQLLLNPKTIQRKLRNWKDSEFIDTYYELEVGCFLTDNGFDVDFGRTFRGNRSKMTPDLFVNGDNVIIEVKTLHVSQEEEKGRESRKVFANEPSKKIRDDVYREIKKYRGQGISHPLIVLMCPDFIERPTFSSDDFEAALIHQVDRAAFSGGKLQLTPDKQFWGLYYLNEGHDCDFLCGVGLWKAKVVSFYENPNVNESFRILPSRLLELFKKR